MAPHGEVPVPTQASALEAILSRRSVRRFLEVPLEKRLVTTLLEAACAAPSAHNRQPWRFVVLLQRETRHRLAVALGARLMCDRLADGDDPSSIREDVERSVARLMGAPALILLCITMEEMDTYADERRRQAEYIMAVQSAAMAGQNILLAAHAHGLGACWLCAPLFCPEVAAEALSLPADWRAQGFIAVGHPAKPSRRRDRKRLSELVVEL